MKNPVPQDHGLVFGLAAITRGLLAEEPYLREGQTARTLARSSELRIVLVALRAGKTISAHHANVGASLHSLSGHVRVRLPDRSVDVPAGGLLVLDAGLSHDVYAEADSTFLLTLGWPANHGARAPTG